MLITTQYLLGKKYKRGKQEATKENVYLGEKCFPSIMLPQCCYMAQQLSSQAVFNISLTIFETQPFSFLFIFPLISG